MTYETRTTHRVTKMWGGDMFRERMAGVWRFAVSTRLAVVLLIVSLMAALVGTLFPQLTPDQAADAAARARWLASAQDKYGPLAGLYRSLGLFDVYGSAWFRLAFAALVVSTLFCTVNRLRAVWRRATAAPKVVQPDAFFDRARTRERWPALAADAGEALVAVLRRHRYRMLVERSGDVAHVYGDRNRLARLGTLATHVGAVLLVLAAVWGRWAGWRETRFTLGPGQTRAVGHGADFALRSGGFEVERYPGGQPRDYRARLAVIEDGVAVREQTVRVNHPLTHRGVSFYLYGYGPSARIRAVDAAGNPLSVREVESETPAEGEIVLNFSGEGDGRDVVVPARDLTLHVVFYYEGPSLFVQAFSGRERQPFAAGSVRAGQSVEVGGVRLQFDPDRYTVLQAVRDPGFGPVVAAAALIVMGMAASFYFPPRRVWARVADGEVWLAGRTERDAVGFGREFAALVAELRARVESDDG